MNLIRILYKARIISPKGLFYLTGSFLRAGTNLMAVLRFASKMYPERKGIRDEEVELTFREMYRLSSNLSENLFHIHHLDKNKKVAIVCRNNHSMLLSMFAVSQIGGDLYFLNVEMSAEQLKRLYAKHRFDLIIHDPEFQGLISESGFTGEVLLTKHHDLPSIGNLLKKQKHEKNKFKKSRSGKIISLTGGTTGEFKVAVRERSVFGFINPFVSLIHQLELIKHKSVYIATPVYHGFGEGSVYMSVILGIETVFLSGFKAGAACGLIEKNKIEVAVLVPLMLKRMIQHNPEKLKSLRCIVSGGAAIDIKTVTNTMEYLGDVLFNLYGTTEGGFALLATPHDLEKFPDTVGKEVRGVKIRIQNENDQEAEEGKVGRICMQSRWTVNAKNKPWIESGDLGYKNKEGYYFLSGRSDDMIVSGGENVYPVELENILITHPMVEEVLAIGIHDDEFGRRLKALVVLKKDSRVTENDLSEWLKGRAARYQQPKQIEITDRLPYTALGKPDRKEIRNRMGDAK